MWLIRESELPNRFLHSEHIHVMQPNSNGPLLPLRLMYVLSATATLMLFACRQSNFTIDTKKPDDNRFTPVVLTEEGAFDEPLNFEVLKDGKVYINERKGALKLFDPITKQVKLVANLPVNTKYTSADGRVTEAEEGFIGFTIDPKFDENHWAYLYYAHPT